MEGALAIGDAVERQRVVTALAVRWLNTDRMSFVAFLDEAVVLDEIEGTDLWDQLIPALRDAFGLVDEKAAASPVLNDAVQKFVEVYVEKDPAAAQAWVEALLTGDARDQAMATIIAATAADDPAAAQALLATIKQPYRRIEGMQGVAAGLAENDPAAAYAWAGEQRAGVERSLAMQSALTTMAQNNPAQAAQFLGQYQTTIDGEAAAALATAPSAAERPRARPGLVGPDDGERQRTPQEAIEANRRDQLGRMADSAAAIAENWAASDPAAAQAWAATLPEGPLRTTAVNAALASAATTDPAAAFAASRATANVSPETTSTIFEQWAATAPTEARARVSELADPAARTAAVGGLVSGWVATDDQAAETWVATLPPGPDRDAGLASLADGLADSDPTGAWRRATEIADPEMRGAAQEDAFAALVMEDVEQARAALDAANNTLSPEIRQKLHRALDGAAKTTR